MNAMQRAAAIGRPQEMAELLPDGSFDRVAVNAETHTMTARTGEGGTVMNIVCAAVNAEQLYQIAETCESPFNQRAKQLADDMINEIRKRARTMSEPPKPVCQGCGKVLAPGRVVCGECASLLDSLIARKGGEQSDQP